MIDLPFIISNSNLDDFDKEYFSLDTQIGTLQQLKKYKFDIAEIIDLHGYKPYDALKFLHLTINKSNLLATECLKIIHGRGNGNGSNLGTLCKMVRKMLESEKRVLAYSKGKDALGGNGITLVKLKLLNKSHD